MCPFVCSSAALFFRTSNQINEYESKTGPSKLSHTNTHTHASVHPHIMINIDRCESFAFVKVAITSVGHEYLSTPMQHLMFADKTMPKNSNKRTHMCKGIQSDTKKATPKREHANQIGRGNEIG